jgi:Endonuclease/Exonuclease/phosphatase family
MTAHRDILTSCLTLVGTLFLAPQPAGAEALTIRVATFNASLNRDTAGQLVSDLTTGGNAQAQRVAEILQRVRPDVLLVNEFDYDASHTALRLFHDNYLALSQRGQAALTYPYRFTGPSNTGVNAGQDFDNNGSIVTTLGTTTTAKNNYGNDCFGFGWFPGQYGMAVYSKFPIDTAAVRTFQKLLWKSLPSPAWPDNLGSTNVPDDWYSTAEKNIFRLSSKSHWDLPLTLPGGHRFHLLCSHPTPPSFDGTEDRNGRRNRDEIRFWAHYVDNAAFFTDDATPPHSGGLPSGERFIILGDLNADPLDGDSYLSAINQLRLHPRINATPQPASTGAVEASTAQGGVNLRHRGAAANDTADFGDTDSPTNPQPGNLRVDHVLPSTDGFTPRASGVFWPATGEPGADLVANNLTTDHRLVWMDLAVSPVIERAVRQLRLDAAAQLHWQAEANLSYSVQISPDLITWTTLPEAVTLDPVTLDAHLPLPLPTTPDHFCRVQATLAAGVP